MNKPLGLLKSKGKRKTDILISVIIVLALFVWLCSNIIYNRTNYEVEFYQVSSSKLSAGIRMIFLSDLHLRSVNGREAITISKKNLNIVIWHDDDWHYSVFGNIPLHTLIRIAENAYVTKK